MIVLLALLSLVVAPQTASPAPSGAPAAPASAAPNQALGASPTPSPAAAQATPAPPERPPASVATPGGSPLPGNPLPRTSPAAGPATGTTPVPSLTPPGASPAPGLSPVPGQSPVPGATPVPGLSPLPAPSPSVTSTPSPFHYRFVPHVNASPAPGEPQIFEVDLNDQVLRSRGDIDIRVVTNPEVNKVISRGNGRGGTVPQVGPGEFITHSKLPAIPFIAFGMTVNLQFVASVPDGRSTTVTVPVKLR